MSSSIHAPTDIAAPTGLCRVAFPVELYSSGTICGMAKTTLNLPDELKRAIEHEAIRKGTSEAEVIRHALRLTLCKNVPRPQGGVFAGREPIADRVDELLDGFGA
ncbi:ribbon-helix-helix domain-containing protein [Agromyces silvae]|uniref:ribbon-helix-helix domain-containing protein n=1 Tax=Agromyces silvae TaxID=3388266 RepID=UPI00280B0D94|nr:CopG family transcriptional regulator [Agromyces protaetiae]